ncbi:retbindin [Spea bombifrons]|uniref:retbindin n=1 Tax=Spea bombifrons TaxID=233779 RepID=UPI00234A9BB8|nr:retbindin [Spea bombifrons]
MSAVLLSLLSSFLLFSISEASPGSCILERKQQKAAPSAEPGLTRCQQYSNNACCSPDLAHVPLSPPFPWDQCGRLSPRCDSYVRHVGCMYLCSPHISAWGSPESATGIKELPLCGKFCDQWFDACKDDLICTAGNAVGTNCSQECVTYTQAFGSGRQMCDNVWDHSFIAVTEPCFCITPTQQGAGISSENPTPADLDSTQEGPSGASEICSQELQKVPSKKRVRKALRKRSVFVEDVEGSGSGF